MDNLLDQAKGRHGIFKFFSNDVHMGTALKKYGEFSEIELSIIKKFIKPGDYVFDIGANIGLLTVPFAKTIGNNGKVFSFEPQLFVYDVLKKNIELNNLINVETFHNGIGSKKTQIMIDEMDFSKTGNFGGFTLSNKYKNSNCGTIKYTNKNIVNILKLDDFINLPKCNLIKIDVELMEIDVLKGGEKLLKKFKPILWLENHQSYPNDLNEYLLQRDYTPYWCATRLFNPDNFNLDNQNVFNNMTTLNTLAIHKSYEIDIDCVSMGITKVTNKYTPVEVARIKVLLNY
ncbi:MAG: hypothetical protein CMP43_03980 [Rickettsiales bacterium]|nr:hypothetical protein [Rickettsiales bacterium]